MIPILLLEVVLADGAGLAVAYVRGSLTDRAIMIVTTVALSISFLVYIIVGQYLFGFVLGWFPVQGWSNSVWTNLVTYAPLPVFLAVLVSLAPQTRLYRSFFLDEIGQDYVRTAAQRGYRRTPFCSSTVAAQRNDPHFDERGHRLAGCVHWLLP